ncbi:CHASE2 domain-containing protein [Plasticicumulans acidivorans]|nr:adenylate/guanylate cyclase domain-containing protein [Plasticicumulans acidivorans]
MMIGRAATTLPSFAATLAWGLVVALLLGLLRYFGLLQGMELAAYDLALQQHLKPAASAQPVVLIGATEGELGRYGWPLSDALLTQLLDRLLAAGAQTIGVDLYRDHPLAPGEAQFERLLTEHSQVFAIMKFGKPGASGVAPPPVLAGTPRVGFSDVPLDDDGRVRRALLFMHDPEGRLYSGFGLRLALHWLAHQPRIFPQADPLDGSLRLGPTALRPLDIDAGPYARNDPRGYQMLLDFADGELPRYSLADVLDGRVDASAFAGRVVIVGVVAASVKDVFDTPVDTRMAGIELHGRIVSQLLRSGLGEMRPLRSLPLAAQFGWIALWALPAALLALRCRPAAVFYPLLFAGLLLVAAAAAVAWMRGWWLPALPAALGWLLAGLGVRIWLARQQLIERRALMRLFARHVSPAVADMIWRERESFLEGGRMRPRALQASVLFADLCEFTPLAEQLSPDEVFEWLDYHLQALGNALLAHGGMIDKYIGDAVMGVFGPPQSHQEHHERVADARAAVDSALEMRRLLDQLNNYWGQRGRRPSRLRIGIHSGPVVAGNLGSDERLEYTVLGDTVNIAARLEAYPWQEGSVPEPCRILISESTRRLIGEDYRVEAVGTVRLKGRRAELTVYRVLDTCEVQRLSLESATS